MNTSQTADVRADELVSAMTLQQKMRWLDEQAANNPNQTTFGTVTYPAQVPCTPMMAYADGPWEVTPTMPAPKPEVKPAAQYSTTTGTSAAMNEFWHGTGDPGGVAAAAQPAQASG